MPSRLSKFMIDTNSCKDFTHPWTDSCMSAQVGLGLHALQESLRIYSTVYLIALLMRRKIPSKKDVLRTILGILQSTAFLSWSAYTYPVFICTLRKLLGNFNIISVSFLPSFLSSLAAIIIERPSRRTLLCLYVANIATETLFRMIVWRGYIEPIPYGNVYIFGASMATLLYFFRSEKPKSDSIFKILKFIVGPYDDPENAKRQVLYSEPSTSKNINYQMSQKTDSKRRKIHSYNLIQESLRVYQNLINWIKNCARHNSCPHPYSCLHFILGGSVKMFGIGLCTQLGLNLIFKFKKFMTKPSLLKAELFKKNNFNLALFIGGFSGIYRLASCLLRNVSNKNSRLHAIPAGLIASVSFAMFPNNTIALYVMWKSLQLLWNNGVEAGKLPEIKWFNIFFYCFCTAILFHAAIIEPQNLRGSYWKFLCTISGGRVAAMARKPLDPFGLETSRHLQEVLKRTNTTDYFPYSY
ncbi:transmembrane protein 135-like [Microplitis mediator]|uniref:transmembrane protein 135-like n=1 Tax=Microplitis mediator TaxID=375433 RepID=UPI002553DC46|nr:transmembrane protein 135-like [Microplitis mediator]